MKQILAWALTPFTVALFALSLLIGHVVLLASMALGNFCKKPITDLFNYLIFSSLKFSGSTFNILNAQSYPLDRPLIIVSNHQSMIDIPFIGWAFRKYHPKFVSKIELLKGAPYVSLSLRNGAGVLIDRRNPRQAVNALKEYGTFIEQNNYSICIFPEGTRGRDGKIKPFKGSGLSTLLKVMPSALVVPIAIDQSWKLVRYKMFPVPIGTNVTLTMFSAIEPKDEDPGELLSRVQQMIKRVLTDN